MERPFSKGTYFCTWAEQCVRWRKLEVQGKLQTGSAARRVVEGIISDRKLNKQLKGKLMEAFVVPVYVYALGRLALTEVKMRNYM